MSLCKYSDILGVPKKGVHSYRIFNIAIILLGGSLSIISTKKIWALYEEDKLLLYIGGLSNRNNSGLSKELPELIKNI